jgi:hypothetical protein
VGRFAYHNPISLLEMNTFLHALFCFSIYAAWWHKPLDIEEPSLIDLSSDVSKGLAAWMVMDSAIGQRRERHKDDTPSDSIVSGRSLRLQYSNDKYSDDVRTNYDQTNLIDSATKYYEKKGLPIDISPTNFALQPAPGSDTLKLYYGQTLYGFRLVGPVESEGLLPYQYHARLTSSDVECLRLAQLFREEDWRAGDKAWRFGIDSGKNWLVSQTSVRYSSDKSMKHLHNKWLSSYLGPDLTFYIALTAAGSVYGGLHLLA